MSASRARPGKGAIRSAAGFCLCDVSFDAVQINAANCADEGAAAIIDIHLWNGVNMELLRHGRPPPDDVDLAQRYLRIATRHLLQARGQHPARAAPVRIKLDNGHIAQCQMLVDVYLRAM